MFYIPVPDGPDTIQTVTLDNIQYSMRFRYSTLSGLWMAYIGSVGKEYSCSVPMTVGFDILKSHNALDGVPKGRMYILDTEKGVGRVGRDDFFGTTSRFRIVYVEVSEL